MKSSRKHQLAVLFLGCVAVSAAAQAEQLKVMTSGGCLGRNMRRLPGILWTPYSARRWVRRRNRLARGEHADVVIMVGYALDELIKQGKVDPASRVELADSRIGMVVKETLLNARSVAYSDSASGMYIEKELFKKLGIQQQLAPKSKMIERIPVASVVAKGDYELGFQQVAELLPIPGVTFVAKIPEDVQSVTRYAAGVPVNAEYPKQARALLDYLASPQAQATVQSTGLDSVPR